MARREYDKLVRDHIPEIIVKQGERPVFDRLSHAECLEYLARKLAEEAGEYVESRDIEELADVIEAVRGILHHRGISWDALEDIRRKKYDARGGFEGGIRLSAVEE